MRKVTCGNCGDEHITEDLRIIDIIALVVMAFIFLPLVPLALYVKHRKEYKCPKCGCQCYDTRI